MSVLPAVSVVIPVLNGARTIADLLTGLTYQAPYPGDVEIIVVDNGSTDDTRAIASRYCDAAASPHAAFPVTLLSAAKRGPSVARNMGLHAAKGEVVAHLDADTLPTRRWLTEIAQPFSDPRVTLAAGRILAFQPTTPAERYYARYYLDRSQENAADRAFPFAASANMAVRRTAALAVGGWDEDFLASQDVDFSYRLLRQFPQPICYQAGALVFLRNHTTMAGLQRQAFKYGQGRARLWRQYPDVAGRRRGLGRRVAGFRLFAAVSVIAAWPLAAHLARWAGQTTDEAVADAECHRAWTWSYWRGFRSMNRHQVWR